MLYSMTGIGRHKEDIEAFSFTWEIKSVNHKYLDTRWRLPSFLRMHEDLFEKMLRSKAQRGRVEISLEVRAISTNPKENVQTVKLDFAQAQAMLDELKNLAQNNDLPFTADISTFLTLPSLWISALEDDSNLVEHALKSLEKALDDWNISRKTEADELCKDLLVRQKMMLDWLTQIEQSASKIKEDRFTNIRERVTQLLQNLGSELEESRFLQEIVLIADKLDVSEEITRLRAHLKRFEKLLSEGGDSGRKLDFTLQECFREVNTCGNKIQDVEVSHIIVDFKTELEKCREQAQNIE